MTTVCFLRASERQTPVPVLFVAMTGIRRARNTARPPLSPGLVVFQQSFHLTQIQVQTIRRFVSQPKPTQTDFSERDSVTPNSYDRDSQSTARALIFLRGH
jgi:hypothetical protein